MDNAEEVMHSLEEFSKLKPKDIPRELEDYLGYVAKTGDPVFKWSIIKCLFREKLLNVITDFYESTLTIELPPCPNVDPFNYERMKANLLEKLESFSGAPFTVQRISELLTNPWKEYNRADKFMRAIEKNILVVSTREPGRFAENEVESQQDTSFNGIAGPNDSGVETSFSCNDIADADSSSQSYEVGALSSQSQSSLVTGASSTSLTSATSFIENVGSIGDSACSNGLGMIRNDEVSQEIIIEEKDTETVICSTINGPPAEIGESHCENVLLPNDDKASDLTIEAESSIETRATSSNISSDIAEDKFKEADVTADVNVADPVDCSQLQEIQLEEKNISLPESSDPADHVQLVNNSQENIEDSLETGVSGVLIESHPAECDTSNSLDSETSNSCDSILETKQTIDNQLLAEGDCKVESSEINEAAPASSYSSNENETENAQKSPEDSNPSTSTSCDLSPMDVEECQISLVDQSQS